MVYCNHDGKSTWKIWKGKVKEIPKEYFPEDQNSCGMIYTGIQKIINCSICYAQYNITDEDRKLAKKSCEEFYRNLKKDCSSVSSD